MGDIYDNAFRTMVNDCSKLMLPLINEMFGEHYTGSEEIDFLPNEHFISQQDEAGQKRITDTNFAVTDGKRRKTYHWECQSTSDSRMLIRLFEYDAQIALDGGESGEESLTVEFPNSAVLYLRSTSRTPDRYRYIIKTPGGTVDYAIPVMKVKSYTLEEIFSKKLLLLIPFFIFTFEADFPEYNTNEGKLEMLKDKYRTILEQLEQLEKQNEIGELDRLTIIELADEVARTLASKYANVMQGVDNIMRGPIIETKAKKAWNAGMQQGMQQGMFSAYYDMIKSGLISTKDAASRLGMSEADLSRKFSVLSLK
ncbi:MAG: hypothetical protein II837_08140 [Treponema sp.]|nr:hypothetical protein [Treponema sp.]MBQ6567338.1 hypothetical protein [Treponema sp.]MBQ7167256.1 hypothetical protein [Treponema sp.]